MTNRHEDEFEENPPDPAATIEALRSLGYSTEAAIADLIDNSIAADAKRVDVRMHWDGTDSWCSVTDDGVGMNEPALKQAMKIGAKDPLTERAASDLGRFGFGLKTASFSQAREVTVATRTRARGQLLTRTWDLDHVRKAGRWLMIRRPAAPVSMVITKHLSTQRGTIVVWRHLTRIADSMGQLDEKTAGDDFVRSIERVEWHLGMTFGRVIARGSLQVTLNGHPVEAWDPFLTGNTFTQQLPAELLVFKNHTVVVQGYVLPHPSKLKDDERGRAGGPEGWNNQQGFYVYRKDRLIASGDWLATGLTGGDNFNLARLSIDVPAELDQAWALDVTKTSVIPPRAILNDLKRIGEATRTKAKKVSTSRGTDLKPCDGRAAVETVWRQTRSNTDLDFHVNRKHPLVESVLREAGSGRRSVENLLRVIEQTIPLPYLVPKNTPRAPLDDENISLVYELAEQVYEQLLMKHASRTDAIEHLKRTEPFDSYPDIIAQLVEKQ